MATKRPPSTVKNPVVFGLAEGEAAMHEQLAKSMLYVRTGSPSNPEDRPTLTKSILNVLNGENNIERLAFEQDPTQKTGHGGVYRPKLRLIPDSLLKRIAIQDSLVANIVRARQNHISSFGRPRPDRFSTGYIIEANTGIIDKLDEEGRKALKARIEKAVKRLENCGSTEGLAPEKRVTFSEYLALSVRSAVVVGRIATEIIYVHDPAHPEKPQFHYFAATDAGTIYSATHEESAQEAVRRQAFELLQQIAGTKKKLVKEKYDKGDYLWVQVIDGRAVEVFTSDEMKCYNFYAVPDVELDGYPVTPLDTVISAVTTHINITTHNKLYFQSGRASRGMLIIKSDDITPQTVHGIKQQFNASINNVNNSWRMPVFGCGVDEEITFSAIDTAGGKDMEFQYLTDMNAREILTAFMMSPDELPGWSYLSKGTNSQALSESNNEFALEAARDVGIRPLLSGFEDFVNTHLFPLIDPELSTQCRVKFVGLQTDNAEKEAVRIQQDQAIWMTYDDVLQRVEKKPLGKEWGGSIPLNPTFKAYLDQYFTVGEVLEFFCGRPNASKDPTLAYRPNPLWLQWAQMQQQAQMAQQQAQQAAQQPPPGGGQGGPDGGSGGSNPPAQTEKQKTEASQPNGQGQAQGEAPQPADATDLARSIDIAFDAMSKSEAKLPPEKRRLLAQQRATSESFMRGFLLDAKDAVAEITDVASHHAPRKK